MGAILEFNKAKSKLHSTAERPSHHVLFHEDVWDATRETYALRHHSQNIHFMDNERHEALHKKISHVPLLTGMMALRTLSILDSLPHTREPVRAIDNLQSAIERARRSRYTDIIERGVAAVAIHALEMQKEFYYPDTPATIIDLGNKLGT